MGILVTPRLNNLISDPAASKKYRAAIRVLEELHVFDLLREQAMESATISSIGSEFGTDIDLSTYHTLCGYISCLKDIQSNMFFSDNTTTKPSIDFGAREELEKQGYSKEEINKMFGE